MLDRGKRFESYRTLPSVTEYALVAQDRVLIERFTRQPDWSWNLRELRAGDRLRLLCAEIAVDARSRRRAPPSA